MDAIDTGNYQPVYRRINDNLIAFDTGDIFNIQKNAHEPISFHRYDYGSICIRGDIYPVDRLIYNAFYGRDSVCRIIHLDGNPRNNAISNLTRLKRRIKYIINNNGNVFATTLIPRHVRDLLREIRGESYSKCRNIDLGNGIIVTILDSL